MNQTAKRAGEDGITGKFVVWAYLPPDWKSEKSINRARCVLARYEEVKDPHYTFTKEVFVEEFSGTHKLAWWFDVRN